MNPGLPRSTGCGVVRPLRRLSLLAWLALALTACAPAAPPESNHTTATAATARPATTTRDMVVAAHPLAAEAGREILRKGGSAADAAIATELVLGLVEPQSSGIGGGAFLLHYDAATGRVDAYDGRETAPAGIRSDVFMAPDGTPREFFDAVVGGQSVGVPGFLRMAALVHEDHGRLPWAELFAPAIRIAEEGFEITPRYHDVVAEAPFLKTFPATRAYFLDAAGEPFPVGTIQRNPAYAETLRTIARDGADAFYEGPIADAVAATVEDAPRNPGTLSVADMAAYRAKERGALCAAYRLWRVCSMPPPTSGGIALLQILGMLERFPLGQYAPDSPDAWHLITEASRLAFADRNRYVADTDFVDVPVAGLLDKDYLAARSALIEPATSLGHAEPGVPPGADPDTAVGASPAQPSTTHLAVVDAAGNAVSMTASIESAYGSRLMVRGFLLNNELTDFSFNPVADGRPVANRVEPGKRPRSSMTPVLGFDQAGHLLFASGSPGGSRIIGYVLKSVIGVLDWNLDMEQAVALPNIVNRNGPTEIEQGPGAEAMAAALAARGEDVKIVDHMTSGLHGIRVRRGELEGGADPRREGVALGD
jgi:gamma-glutamyltranspeptidase/glutathione hydrolase